MSLRPNPPIGGAVAIATTLVLVVLACSSSPAPSSSHAPEPVRKKLVAGMKILLIGDSLAQGLGPLLKKHAEAEGMSFRSMAKESTRIDQWATNPAVDAMLAEYQPDVVFVSLGTNDEYMGGAAVKQQTPYLEKLLGKLGADGRRVVWIGPPSLPKPTNGIVPLISSRVPSGEYYHSDTLTLPRISDKIHPTSAGYVLWADAFWQWLRS